MFSKSIFTIKWQLTSLFAVLLIFFGLFSTTSVAKASTIEDLQAQIAVLMAQIVALQEASSTTPATKVSPSTAEVQVGLEVTVTSPLRVRVAPGLNALYIATQPIGAIGIVTAGPIVKDGYNWFKVDYATGTDGWNVGNWLRNRTDLPDVLGTYIGYMDGQQFIRTENIKRSDALVNCKLKATGNPTKVVRCTFQGKEIFVSTENLYPNILVVSRIPGKSFITARIAFFVPETSVSPVTGPVKIGSINWGDGTSEDVYALVHDTRIITNSKHTYGSKGLYTITATSLDGKTNIKTVSVNVLPQPTPSEKIKVTVPDGGEAWEIGVTNTVTWTPYNYSPDVNPAKDVTAYLETKNADGSFKTLGKVEESGKASIHWPTGELNSKTVGENYAPAGSGYYIRVVNNVNGATDRSDRPFTLLPKSVDLKVNNSDGPVNVAKNERVTFSWKTTGVHDCKIQNGYTDISRSTEIGSVPANGSTKGYLSQNLSWGPTLYCINQAVNSSLDSVKRTSTGVIGEAVVKVLSPNGGESINPKKSLSIKYVADGISTMSVGLYKNNQWKAWIRKDINVQTDPEPTISFIPSNLVQGLGEGDNSGAIFKIYITGQLASGAGYTDDKSDQPFAFVTGVATSSYTLADVKTVTAKVIDPIPGAVDDEYTLYHIELKNGKVYEVKVGYVPVSYRDEQFRKTGYTGDIDALIAMATVTKPTPNFYGTTFPLDSQLTIVNAVFGISNADGGIPAVTGPTKVGSINWGDGKVENVFALITGKEVTVTKTHTYEKVGKFTITLIGLNGKKATKTVNVTVIGKTNPTIIEPEAGGLVKGVSTDIYSQILVSLEAIRATIALMK